MATARESYELSGSGTKTAANGDFGGASAWAWRMASAWNDSPATCTTSHPVAIRLHCGLAAMIAMPHP